MARRFGLAHRLRFADRVPRFKRSRRRRHSRVLRRSIRAARLLRPLPKRLTSSRVPLRPPARSGFTLLELLTVLVIIVVLAVLGVGMFDQIRARSERVNCTANLRNLYTGFQSYIVQYGHWPQNPHKLADKDHDG